MNEERQFEFDSITGESILVEQPSEGVEINEEFEQALNEAVDQGFADVDREAVQTEDVQAKRQAFEDSAISLNIEYAEMLPKKLPVGLEQTLQNVPDRMKMPVLFGVMPLAAAYATNVRARYCDGKMHRLNLMSIIYGRQASGKSNVRDAVDLWISPMKWADEVGRAEEEAFKAKRKSRKANEKLPEEPRPIIREVPITISCSTLLKRFKNAQGQHLYSFGEELGTLQKTNGAGSWSSKYDIYRLSFDNGSWGQDYNSDQAESGVVDVAYNWSVLGTLGAVEKCFKADSIENGMCGRVMFAQMPSEFYSHMPVYAEPKPVDHDKIIEAVEKLKAADGEIELPRLSAEIREWVDRKADQARTEKSLALDTLRKRAAVIGFRCGVIYYLLQGSEKETPNMLKFATTIADYCLDNQMAIFGTQLNEVLEMNKIQSAPESARGKFQKLFSSMPEEFTKEQIFEASEGRYTINSMRANISRFVKFGYIVKVRKGVWRKTEEGKKL